MAAMMVATAAAIPAPARDTVADGMLRDAIRRRVQQKTMSKADVRAQPNRPPAHSTFP
jgi:hypothetical protein